MIGLFFVIAALVIVALACVVSICAFIVVARLGGLSKHREIVESIGESGCNRPGHFEAGTEKDPTACRPDFRGCCSPRGGHACLPAGSDHHRALFNRQSRYRFLFTNGLLIPVKIAGTILIVVVAILLSVVLVSSAIRGNKRHRRYVQRRSIRNDDPRSTWSVASSGQLSALQADQVWQRFPI